MRLAILLAAALAAGPTGASRSPGVAYDLYIAGIPIGDANLDVHLDGGRYRIEGAADFGFLMWGGEGVAVAEGAAGGGALRPDSYRLRYQGMSRPGSVDIAFEGGRAVRWEREPEIPPEFRDNRTPPSGEELANVLDPLTALVVPAALDTPADALCRRVLPVFSGYTRFDLSLEGASALDGDAVECAVRYRAISGHRRDSRGVRRLSRPGALEIRLAPLGPEIWGPDRVAVATRFGTFEMERRR